MQTPLNPLRTRFTRRTGVAGGAALALPLVGGLGQVSAAPAGAAAGRAGAVYTLTNATGGNAVAAFDRAADGTLAAAGTVATGGTGTGTGLGSQGALALSKDGGWLYAVNPGSDTIAVLPVTDKGLGAPVRVPASGGRRPISLTVSKTLLYVLNEASGTLAGFAVGPQGALTPLPNSTVALPGGAPSGPAQVSFTPDGAALVVTQKAANAIVSYAVGPDGRLGAPSAIASAGAVPFGFEFAGNTLVVSEASGGASSYEVRRSGGVHAISRSVPDRQRAACWVAATEDGRFAYVANAGSGSISAYRVDGDGRLTLRDADGLTASTGAASHPTDEALSAGSGFLYVLLTPAASSSISGMAVGPDGGLRPVTTAGGLPANAAGLVAR
jgi:6-phosphogluconolactonase (cycloisomerase 2 family)